MLGCAKGGAKEGSSEVILSFEGNSHDATSDPRSPLMKPSIAGSDRTSEDCLRPAGPSSAARSDPRSAGHRSFYERRIMGAFLLPHFLCVHKENEAKEMHP